MPEHPVLTIVRLVRWGSCGFRYIIAEGVGHPLVYRSAFQDIADTFPDDAVLVVATYLTHCELVASRRYTAIRPIVKGW
jgi:hypothetical protein